MLAVHIEVDGSKTLADVELLTRKVEMVIHSKIPYIKKISVIPHSLPIHSEPTSILQTEVTMGLLKTRNKALLMDTRIL